MKKHTLSQKHASIIVIGIFISAILFPTALLGSMGVLVTIYLITWGQLPGDTSLVEYLGLMVALIVAIIVTFYLKRKLHKSSEMRKDMSE